MLLDDYTKIIKTKSLVKEAIEVLENAKKEKEVKNKLFIVVLIKVCVAGNITFYDLNDSIYEIRLQLFNFQKELHNVIKTYLNNKRLGIPITP
jgi:hypothetical protein